MRDAGPVLHPQTCSLQDSDRFRFTPVKRASTLPRLWDRKPSTSFLGRTSRPRTVWKRFRTSFNSMKAVETELDTEINAARSAGWLRGVKRRCLAHVGEMDRRRSFLETKWEGEVRRRKLPAPCNEQLPETGRSSTSDLEADSIQDESDIGPKSPTLDQTAYPELLHGTSSCHEESEEIKPRDGTPTLNASETTMDEPEPEKDAPVQEITSAEQESTLVRSALRSSLDGEDAELLNNFLTKARAKRAAKAATVAQENVQEEKAVKDEVPDMPTPRARRALEELDANSPSPSPQKARMSSPKKADNPPASPIRKEIANDNNENEQAGDEQQPSPVSRRSARVRAPPRTTTTAIRNTLSLRRAKGTEFVFLQRSEAQELALATRKNTRQNKGSAVFPKYVLKNLARKQESDQGSPSPTRNANKKGNRVCWNDARLVEFEDGDEPQPAPSERGSSHELSDGDSAQSPRGNEKQTTASRTRSQRAQKGSEDTATLAPPKTAAAAPAGRVRRLGSVTPTKSKSPSSSKDTTATPTGKRKKLTPKSPSSIVLSPAKNTTATTTTTTAASKVPKPTSRTSTPAAKSKSIFKANAGSTPMPKRVRGRA